MDTTSWTWFRYDEIFDIKHGFYNKKPDDNPQGDIPFIGATDSNNGVTSHSDLETIENTTKTGEGNNAPLSDKLFENCIAVTNNGSVGYAYYQDKPFTCTHDVNPLYLKGHKMNRYIALFLCTLIEKERFRWAYGRKWRPTRMPSSLIKLPVTSDGKPDWQYMENFVKNTIIPNLPQKAKEVWTNNYDKTPILSKKIALHTELWKTFRYNEIFDIKKGKRLTIADQESGDIPYVSSSSVNNAVDNYIANGYTDENCISMACYGSIGEVFYHPGKVWISDNATALYLKEIKLNKYIAMFIISILNREKYRFSYGVTGKKNRMQEMRIKLPITTEGTPDWKFMENYIKSLPYSKNI